MKLKKLLFLMALLATTVAFVGCKDDDDDPIVQEEEEEGTATFEDVPNISAPAEGYTLVVCVPEINKGIGGLCVCGVGIGENGTDDWAPDAANVKFTKVAGTERWWQVTLPTTTGGIKVCAIPDGETTSDWNYQWGMNVEGEEPNVVFVVAGEESTTSSVAEFDATEHGGEVKLTNVTMPAVVFVNVHAFKTNPTVVLNEAGEATFTVTIKGKDDQAVPAGISVAIAGSFPAPDDWKCKTSEINPDHILTAGANNTFSKKMQVPAKIGYKYIIRLAEGKQWVWEDGNNRNILAEANLKATDEVVIDFAGKAEDFAKDEDAPAGE